MRGDHERQQDWEPTYMTNTCTSRGILLVLDPLSPSLSHTFRVH